MSASKFLREAIVYMGAVVMGSALVYSVITLAVVLVRIIRAIQ